MPALQIWTCHVTQEANFEKNLLFLILHLILGKVAKFVVEKLSTSEVISQKPHGGGGKHPPPPVLLGLKDHATIIMGSKCNYVSIIKAGHQDLNRITVG